MKRNLSVVIMAVLLVIAYFAGMYNGEQELANMDHAKYALKKMNLPAGYAPQFCLHGGTGIRDSYGITAFQVQCDREDLLKCIQRADGWTVAPVSEEELRGFAESFWYPELMPVPDNTVFDAWFYRETAEPTLYSESAKDCFSSIGKIGRGFEFAVFDVETGMVIYVDQFG